MADELVQIRIKGRHIIQEGRMRDGQTPWVTRQRAKQYIDLGIAEPFFPANPGPSETKPAGPSETKPAGGAEKKSSAAETDTHSTDSARSSEALGQDASSSASAADPASQASSSGTSSARVTRGRRRSVS